MTQLSDVAWSRQLSRTSRGQMLLWTTAALVMFTAHAGAAWWVMNRQVEDTIQIAGSVAIEVDLAALGFADADQTASGEPTEMAEPVETAEPAEAVTVTAAVTPDVEPVSAAQPVETARPVEPVQPRTEPVEVQPLEPVQAQAVAPSIPDLVEAESDVEIAAVVPVQPETVTEPEAVEAVQSETVKPVQEEEEVAAIVNVPLPTPRPEYTPAPRPQPQRTERPRREQPRQQARRPSSGSAGQNQADARRGSAQGSAQGTATNQSAGNQRRSEAGNAAVSNYPGQVARRLSSAVRPQRSRERGQVVISFTVGRSGSVSGIRIARGSGSQALDQAAIDTVNRAAPFPPIPDAAGRASWTFSLPVAFTR